MTIFKNIFWEYGTCYNYPARKNKLFGNVQYLLFKKGDLKYIDNIGHPKNVWRDFDKGMWGEFKKTIK
jgi:hypothetical protein